MYLLRGVGREVWEDFYYSEDSEQQREGGRAGRTTHIFPPKLVDVQKGREGGKEGRKE